MRRLLAEVLLALAALACLAAQTNAQLETARKLLTGEHKDTKGAERVLLEIVQAPRGEASPQTLTYAYVYLGYIEDLAGNRQRAIDWFRKAVGVEGAPPGILALARAGLEHPVIRIPHLDEPNIPATPAVRVPAAPPPVPPLARNLTENERRENFESLWRAIDVNYACFRLKSIDWTAIGRQYRTRLETIRDDGAFYQLLFQLVNELKDTHSWLQNFRPPPLIEAADVSVDLVVGRPFIVAVRPGSAAAAAGVAAGSEVLSIDDLTPAEKIEELRLHLHACSSERAFRREAVRHLLAAADAAPASVKLRSPNGETKSFSLQRTGSPVVRPPVRSVDFALTRQRFVHFGRHPSGLGYIWIESFNEHKQVADEFDHALEALRDTPGLLLDIRDNTGGFGQPRIVGRLLTKHELVDVSYIKTGPGHSDLTRHEGYLDPSGPWQYARPIALLLNDLTGSASDLFACELRSARRVVTVGTRTHGNLSGVAQMVTLPCGLTIRISNGYVADATGHPIEGAGSAPDIEVEPTIEDVLTGRDPVMDKAVSAIASKRGEARSETSRPGLGK